MLSSATFWIWLYSFALVSMGDQIVYLDRLNASNGTMWEPYFNPQSITADIGEQIHFVARLENIGAIYGTSFMPVAWGFAESNYSTPCRYNQGVFSGFWVMDPEGSWNGSVFTLVVTDTQPHFFYSISMDGWYLKNCTRLLDYHSSFTIPNGSDVIFALNPSSEDSFDGYKQLVGVSVGVAETYPYDVHDGELYFAIGEPQCPVTVTATTTLGACQSFVTATTTVTGTPTAGSESETSSTVTSTSSSSGVSVAAVIGIAIASFIVGIIVSWGVMIAGGILKKRPREKITANGTVDAEGGSEEEGN